MPQLSVRFLSRICLWVLFLTMPVFAQAPAASGRIDIAGEWAIRITEDSTYRCNRFILGDTTGLPLNAAAQQKADTWSAATLALREHQTKPFGAPIALRSGVSNLRIQKINDPVTQVLIAYTLEGLYGRPDRVIWMDGRPHPSAYAEHTWDGYSTGVVKGNQLIVTTTHMKPDKIQRNGVPYSFEAKMTEHFIRHGDLLTVATMIEDPVYLDEPLMRTTQWVRGYDVVLPAGFIFEAVDELAERKQGAVQSFPLGTKHEEFAITNGLPFELTLGGKETIYPEYELKVREILAKTAKNGTPAK